MPTSSTFTFELYDKYVSGSNYGRSVYVQTTINDNPTSVTVLPSTSIQWRRMAYYQLRTDAGALRLTFSNTYQYVSTYNTATNSINEASSSGMVLSLPSTLTASTKYTCLIREYLPTQYYLYNELNIDCLAYSATQVGIKAVPGRPLSPAFNYELIVYVNAGSGSSLVPGPSNNYNQQVWSGTNVNPSSLVTTYYDAIPVFKYQQVNPITLNSIYFLSW